MPIKCRVAERSLLQKGFKKDQRNHKFFIFYYRDKKTDVFTYLSHGSRSEDIDDSLLKLIKKELRLDDNQQTRDLLNCPLDGQRYAEILLQKGII